MVNALLIHDIERQTESGTIRWAYANRTLGLARNAPEEWDVRRVSIHDTIDMYRNKVDVLQDADVVLNLDYQSVASVRSVVGHTVPLISSFNKDTSANTQYWEQCYTLSDYVICNNLDRYLWATDNSYDRVCYISNGVDTDFWSSSRDIDSRSIDVGWSGSSSPKKGKGFCDIIAPLKERLNDVKCSFRPIVNSSDAAIYTAEQQREWYSSCKTMLCVSKSEGGGPSSLMEAMSCGCIPVSVLIGNMPEMGRHGQNCYIIDRSVDDAEAGIRSVLSDEDIQSLSNEARRTIEDKYAYSGPDGIAKWFYELMKRVAENEAPRAFDYQSTHWSEM